MTFYIVSFQQIAFERQAGQSAGEAEDPQNIIATKIWLHATVWSFIAPFPNTVEHMVYGKQKRAEKSFIVMDHAISKV